MAKESILLNLLFLDARFRGREEINDFLFLCDRELFLKENMTATAHWPGMAPDLEHRAFPSGPRLFFRGVPWKPMALLDAMMRGAKPPEDFCPGNFCELELDVIDRVSRLDAPHDPLRWVEKTLDAKGSGAAIDFDEFERAVFPAPAVEERRASRKSHLASIKAFDSLSRRMEGEPPADWAETYRVIDLRDPVAGCALRGLFGECRFLFERCPARDRADELFSYPFAEWMARGKAIDCAPECSNPWIVVKIEDGYPRIIDNDSLAGFESLEKARAAILADMEDRTPWLATIHAQTWQKDFHSLNAVPQVFRSPATASAWLCENCGFSRDMRAVLLFIDGIDTAYADDQPGKPGWRIVKAEII